MKTTSQWYVYSLAGAAYLLPPQVWKQDPRTGAAWAGLQTILGFDPSAYTYPLAGNYNPGGYTRLPLPTQLFGTGALINVHSTTTIGTQAYGDLRPNDPSRPFTVGPTTYSGAGYWLTQGDFATMLAGMFHSAGDVNSDGKVDTADTAAIGLAMQTVPGDPLWNAQADVCGPAGSPPDSTVNVFDSSTAGKFFGETRTISWP
jgi:hypothetical protein